MTAIWIAKTAALLGAIVVTSFVSPAFAIDKPAGPVVSAKPLKMSPTNLTSAECTGLGGKVLPSVNTCTSGSMCITTNKDGVVHNACIEKK